MENIRDVDPEVADAIEGEIEREELGLEMIASENCTSHAVMEAQGSVMTNKYAEGYPDARYYGGCEYMDVVEDLARDRAKEVFGAEHVNVQPHSGTQANMAVYMTVLEPGDKILGMDLTHGGHLSHGHPANFSGKLFDVESYEVDEETGRIDYAELESHAREFEPDVIVSGASAYPREIDFEAFGEIAEEVGAYHVSDIAHIAGLVAAGEHQSPVPHADFVTTTTHKTLRGPRGGMVMCDEEHASDINSTVFPGVQGGPLMHVISAKAVCLKEAETDEFAEYQRQIVRNTDQLAETLTDAGYDLVSDGSDNHLVLMDLRGTGVTGKGAENALGDVEITVNKNTVPGEERPPTIASGVRIGTPAVTTRGLGTEEIQTVGEVISTVLDNTDSSEVKEEAADTVRELCEEFPLYPDLYGEVS
ncbi:MAG: serine hydroxymethyltransferase [Halobacteria archaeon]